MSCLRLTFVMVIIVCCMALITPQPCSAQESPSSPPQSAETPAAVPGEPLPSSLPSVATWLQAAQDLRLAAEAVERVSPQVAAVVEAVAFYLAETSRQFDPLGFKTAVQTIQEQNRIIQEQHRMIQKLLEAEIDRLEQENERLRNGNVSDDD